MLHPIVLLGAEKSGKSTVGKLLAASLGVPHVHLWSIAEPYWKEAGYEPEGQGKAWEAGGAEALYRYMAPFDAHAIERAIPDHPDCVLELGSPQCVYDDPALLARVQKALDPVPTVVLLAPSPDEEESLAILEGRRQVLFNGLELNEHFLKHHSNHDLAKYVFYTHGKSPEETRDEILARIDPAASDIILIGAMGAGKSTQGRLLAEKLGLPEVAMDNVRWGYYKEIGWDEATQQEIGAREGFAGVYRYWKKFELYAVERVLTEHKSSVIHFGAGHSVFEDDAMFARARDLLAPYANVILLQPTPDLEESAQIFRERQRQYINGIESSRFFFTHPSNRTLAKQVVYTESRTPEQTRDEILAHYHRN